MERTAKFLKTSGGTVEFAQVTLAFDLDPTRAGVVVEVAVKSVNREDGGTAPEHEPEWFEAAIEAIRAVVAEYPARHGIIRIMRIRGTVVDTTPSAVATAARQAARELLDAADGPPMQEP